jgi:hypothetical protein
MVKCVHVYMYVGVQDTQHFGCRFPKQFSTCHWGMGYLQFSVFLAILGSCFLGRLVGCAFAERCVFLRKFSWTRRDIWNRRNFYSCTSLNVRIQPLLGCELVFRVNSFKDIAISYGPLFFQRVPPLLLTGRRLLLLAVHHCPLAHVAIVSACRMRINAVARRPPRRNAMPFPRVQHQANIWQEEEGRGSSIFSHQ